MTIWENTDDSRLDLDALASLGSLSIREFSYCMENAARTGYTVAYMTRIIFLNRSIDRSTGLSAVELGKLFN